MELAVVPFVGSSSSARGPGSARGNPNAALGDGGDLAGSGRSGGGGGGGGLDAAVPYGQLAPTTVSTERVCPHCLRPYDYYDEDPYADLYDSAGGFYGPGDVPPKQLPALPPTASPEDADEQATQPQQAQQQRSPYFIGSNAPALATTKTLTAAAGGSGVAVGSKREGGGTPPRVTSTRNPSLAHHKGNADVTNAGSGGSGQRNHNTGSPAYPPPAITFTAHYFRALPPPAVLAAAAATNTSPLAIEDYHNPIFAHGDAEDEEGSQSPPMYAAVVAGGQQQARALSAYSGALVPARATPAVVPPPSSSSRFSRGSPAGRRAPGSPLKLMQSEEEEDASEQVSLPPDAAPDPLQELIDNEEAEAEKQQQLPTEEWGGSPSSSMYSPNAPGPAPNNGYYKHYFKELRQLGRGTYGGVYLCRHLMCGVNLGEFALKKIPVGDKAGYLQSVLREVRILEEVRRHPNVVEYKHSWVEDAQLADFGPPVRCLFILMEYASAGSLDAYLEKYGTHLSTLAVWYFFLSAVAGTSHLHQKHILHRDLKPQNLLLAESKGRPPRVLVSDFGTAAILDDISYERSGGTGTLEYMAPELFETAASPRGVEEHYVNHHTVASDVWSLGMILYYLAFDATLPERRADGSVVLNTPRQASYGRPPEMLHLMEAMLQLDPTKRPRCSDILGSSLVQSILRTFNQEDQSQWDLLAQQQERTRKGAAATMKKTKTPSPPQASLSPRLAHASAAGAAAAPPGINALALAPSEGRRGGKHVLSPHNNNKMSQNNNISGSPNHHRITITSTTAPALQLRRHRQTASNDSAISDNETLYSSRVVELQSTTGLLDLAVPRPGSGTIFGDEQQQQQQQAVHGRGHAVRRLSPTATRQEGKPQPRSSFSHRPRSSQTGSVSSPVGTPPPNLVDEGVQTDPVKIVYE